MSSGLGTCRITGLLDTKNAQTRPEAPRMKAREVFGSLLLLSVFAAGLDAQAPVSRYTSACQTGPGQEFPDSSRTTEDDRRTLFRYLPQELRDRPKYVERRAEELASKVTCVAVEGRTVGRPWHPQMLMLHDEEFGEFQVFFESQNLVELDLWQNVHACLEEGAYVVVVGEFGGLRRIQYSLPTWEDGQHVADAVFAGGVRPVIRRARLRLLWNTKADTMQSPEEWFAWLDANPDDADQMRKCSRERVAGYRDRLATRVERRQAAEASLGDRIARWEELRVNLFMSLQRCESSRRCGKDLLSALQGAYATANSCQVDGCGPLEDRIALLIRLVEVEVDRPAGWKDERTRIRELLRLDD